MNGFPPNLKFLVTGCPCSGTGYVAKTLHERGVKVGHEAFEYVASEDRWGQLRSEWHGTPAEEMEVEVNHYLSPKLRFFSDSGLKVVHLVRDPLKVLNSRLAFRLQQLRVASGDMLAERIWLENESVSLSPLTVCRHRVEDPIEELAEAMGVVLQPPAQETPEDYNAHNQGRCSFTWEDFKGSYWCDAVKEQYRTYGYE